MPPHQLQRAQNPGFIWGDSPPVSTANATPKALVFGVPDMSEPTYPVRRRPGILAPYAVQFDTLPRADSHGPQRDRRTLRVMFRHPRARRIPAATAERPRSSASGSRPVARHRPARPSCRCIFLRAKPPSSSGVLIKWGEAVVSALDVHCRLRWPCAEGRTRRRLDEGGPAPALRPRSLATSAWDRNLFAARGGPF